MENKYIICEVCGHLQKDHITSACPQNKTILKSIRKSDKKNINYSYKSLKGE